MLLYTSFQITINNTIYLTNTNSLRLNLQLFVYVWGCALCASPEEGTGYFGAGVTSSTSAENHTRSPPRGT